MGSAQSTTWGLGGAMRVGSPACPPDESEACSLRGREETLIMPSARLPRQPQPQDQTPLPRPHARQCQVQLQV